MTEIKPEIFVSVPHSCGSNTYELRKEITITVRGVTEQEWIICTKCKERIQGHKGINPEISKTIYKNKQ